MIPLPRLTYQPGYGGQGSCICLDKQVQYRTYTPNRCPAFSRETPEIDGRLHGHGAMPVQRSWILIGYQHIADVDPGATDPVNMKTSTSEDLNHESQTSNSWCLPTNKGFTS